MEGGEGDTEVDGVVGDGGLDGVGFEYGVLDGRIVRRGVGSIVICSLFGGPFFEVRTIDRKVDGNTYAHTCEPRSGMTVKRI